MVICRCIDGCTRSCTLFDEQNGLCIAASEVYSCSRAYPPSYGYGSDGGIYGVYGAYSGGMYGGAEFDVDYTYVVDRLGDHIDGSPTNPGPGGQSRPGMPSSGPGGRSKPGMSSSGPGGPSRPGKPSSGPGGPSKPGKPSSGRGGPSKPGKPSSGPETEGNPAVLPGTGALSPGAVPPTASPATPVPAGAVPPTAGLATPVPAGAEPPTAGPAPPVLAPEPSDEGNGDTTSFPPIYPVAPLPAPTPFEEGSHGFPGMWPAEAPGPFALSPGDEGDPFGEEALAPGEEGTRSFPESEGLPAWVYVIAAVGALILLLVCCGLVKKSCFKKSSEF